jgi:predicted secreted protein
MGGTLRRGVQRALDHPSHLRIRYCSRATRTIFVGQPFNAVLYEPPPPFADRVLVDTEALGNFLALQPLCTEQNHPASI